MLDEVLSYSLYIKLSQNRLLWIKKVVKKNGFTFLIDKLLNFCYNLTKKDTTNDLKLWRFKMDEKLLLLREAVKLLANIKEILETKNRRKAVKENDPRERIIDFINKRCTYDLNGYIPTKMFSHTLGISQKTVCKVMLSLGINKNRKYIDGAQVLCWVGIKLFAHGIEMKNIVEEI